MSGCELALKPRYSWEGASGKVKVANRDLGNPAVRDETGGPGETWPKVEM